jgi:hypothetical protein
MAKTKEKRINQLCISQGVNPYEPCEYILYLKRPDVNGKTKYKGATLAGPLPRLRNHPLNMVSRIVLKPIKTNIWEQDSAGNKRAVNNPSYKNTRGGFGGLKCPVRYENATGEHLANSLTDAERATGVSRRSITTACKSGGGDVNGFYFQFDL